MCGCGPPAAAAPQRVHSKGIFSMDQHHSPSSLLQLATGSKDATVGLLRLTPTGLTLDTRLQVLLLITSTSSMREA